MAAARGAGDESSPPSSPSGGSCSSPPTQDRQECEEERSKTWGVGPLKIKRSKGSCVFCPHGDRPAC